MDECNHLVIMAGGVGSRFWPMSTMEYPKQFIDVLGCGKTLIQLTLERFGTIFPKDNVWIVTSEKYRDVVKEQLPDLDDEHILLEPCRRNTAPCIAYVSWKIKSKYPKANLVITPSDHIVTNVEEFQRVIRTAMNYTRNTDAIVTLGMKPTRPETGYGYIEADYSMPSMSNKGIYRVDSFKEKPDLATAKQYVAKPNFFWNAGIFIWNVNTIVNSFRVYQPPMANIFENLLKYYFTDDEQKHINEDFPLCENISVDYAILEKAEEIFVMPADFGWSDSGTWSSLHDQSKTDAFNNALIGDHIEVYDTRNCVIHATDEKKVVVQGLDGFIVVEKDGKLLICKLSEEQRIKLFSGNN